MIFNPPLQDMYKAVGELTKSANISFYTTHVLTKLGRSKLFLKYRYYALLTEVIRWLRVKSRTGTLV